MGETAGRIDTGRDGAVGRIVIANPARHNAIGPEMARALSAAVEAFTKDDTIRVIAVTGAGTSAFVSGADIGRLGEADAGGGPESAVREAINAVRACPKPTVALIRGICYGAGVALALACDLRLATPDTIFSIPAVRLALAYPPEFTRWLVEVVGVARAKEFLLTGRRYEAADALAMGLLHKVTPGATFANETAEYCMHLSHHAPLAMQANKRIVEEVANGLGVADADLCARLLDQCAASADHAEGRRAFAEKRAPRFTGA